MVSALQAKNETFRSGGDMKRYSRRDFLKTTGWTAAAVLAQGSLSCRPSRRRPNILFLLADDQRSDILGCAGHPFIKTPVIDSLASGGIRFSNAFVTTSICAASRASILTGLYERSHRYTFGTPPLSPEKMAESYPALLRAAGYRTGFVGKYGVKTEGEPEPSMFDFFKPHTGNPYFKEQPDGTLRHETEVAGDRALEFLDGNPPGQPFCLSISFNAPHAADWDLDNHYPWPKAVDGLYEEEDIPAPRLSDPVIFENHPEFLKTSLNRKRYFWRWDTPEKYQKNMKAYFRMISGIDRVIGRIRGELERRGLAEDTVIIYMADNGYYMGDRGFAGKWSHYEQSLRVPLIVFDPGLPKKKRGSVRDEMALNIDIPATILQMAGVEIPARYQGRSLTPLLEGRGKGQWREDFFCEHLMDHPDIPKWEGVRGKRFVYASYFQQEPVIEFLHDLEADPDQLVNLAPDPGYGKILADMQNRCEEFKEKLD
jgi:arylsulfatase A-like enzyme